MKGSRIRVIGVDPGPTTGLALLHWNTGHEFPWDPRDGGPDAVVQCNAFAAPMLLDALTRAPGGGELFIAIEDFAVTKRSRVARAAGATTREILARCRVVAERTDARVVVRSSDLVKPWAIDDRLAAVRTLEPTKNMPHARDAARHALYAAVRDAGISDPMSKKGV